MRLTQGYPHALFEGNRNDRYDGGASFPPAAVAAVQGRQQGCQLSVLSSSSSIYSPTLPTVPVSLDFLFGYRATIFV